MSQTVFCTKKNEHFTSPHDSVKTSIKSVEEESVGCGSTKPGGEDFVLPISDTSYCLIKNFLLRLSMDFVCLFFLV